MARHSKVAILDFYLNQAPYAAQRRDVFQAARYYFDRDLDTLRVREILSLAVMVCAPAHLDLHKDPAVVDRAALRLAGGMHKTGWLSESQFAAAKVDTLGGSVQKWRLAGC